MIAGGENRSSAGEIGQGSPLLPVQEIIVIRSRSIRLLLLGALPACWPQCTGANLSDTDEDTTPTTGSDSFVWGEEVEALPEYYPAADVGQDQIELVGLDYGTASAAWGNFGPIEYWIVGTDLEAAAQHDIYYCSVRQEKDSSLSSRYEQHCLNRGYNFEDYARDGGAGLNVLHSDEEEYSAFIITLASMYPFPNETDYTVVGYHEYFHVVQNAHIATRQHQERREMMVENPWWSEGGAEYMAQLLYSRQPGVRSGYLKEQMERKMGSRSLLEEGESITNIPYGERARVAYDLGTWFIAYLVHQVGEDAYRVGFYDDLNDLGWEGSFVENFGVSSESMLDGFELLLEEPLSAQLEIIP
jgi:hypothetical protein